LLREMQVKMSGKLSAAIEHLLFPTKGVTSKKRPWMGKKSDRLKSDIKKTRDKLIKKDKPY